MDRMGIEPQLHEVIDVDGCICQELTSLEFNKAWRLMDTPAARVILCDRYSWLVTVRFVAYRGCILWLG